MGAERPEPSVPEITVRGGPDGVAPAAAAAPGRRGVLLAVAALAVGVGVALVQGRESAPGRPACPDPCASAGALVVGTVLPTTGVLAPFGRAQERGVQRVVDEVNADGGLEVAGRRRRVELLVRDTTSLPDVAGQSTLVLARGPYGLLGLIGPCSPPVAMVSVAESRQVPLVTGCQPLPRTGARPLRHTWEVAPEESRRAAAVFAALRPSAGSPVGLFLSNDREAEPWTTAARHAGFGRVRTYRPQGREWGPAVAQAARDGVAVVVAVTQPPEGIGLWRELHDQGVVPRQAYASEAGLGSAWTTAVGRDADGTLTDVVHPAAGPLSPVEVDDGVATVSAELTRVLVDGLRRTRAAERPALEVALDGAGGRVSGADVRFRADRASPLPVRLGRWQDGRLVPLTPSP